MNEYDGDKNSQRNTNEYDGALHRGTRGPGQMKN